MSVTAPVKISGELDLSTGDIAFAEEPVQNNSASMDIVADSAAFHAADGVSGDWKATLGGEAAQLPLDGTDTILGVEIGRGESSALSLDTTFSGSAAGKMVDKSLGSLTLTFSEKKEAFAVFSADDGFLTFYKRGTKPAAGSVYDGKIATAVYTGFEDKTYGAVGYDEGDHIDGWPSDGDQWYRGIIDTPWFGVKDQIKTVSVADDGIRPKATNHWFYRMINLESADLDKLDASEATDARMMFCLCVSLRTLEAPRFSDRLRNLKDFVSHCRKLESLDLSASDLSNASDFFHFAAYAQSLKRIKMADSGSSPWRIEGAFEGCLSLEAAKGLERWRTQNVESFNTVFQECLSLRQLDLSSWSAANLQNAYNTFFSCEALSEITFGPDWKWIGDSGYLPVPSSTHIPGADGKWYNADTGTGYIPADVPGGVAATYVAGDPKTAFAVYSADDGSLRFYNRTHIPSAGDTFEGRFATEVFQGIDALCPQSKPDLPWNDIRGKIETTECVDEGIRPKSAAFWFSDMKNLRDCDMARLDTSSCGSLYATFMNCNVLEQIDLSNWDVRNVASINRMFAGCSALKSLDLSNWKTNSLKDLEYTFFQCQDMTSLNVSGWDVSQATTLDGTFNELYNLVDFQGIESWDTASVESMINTFCGVHSMTSLNLSGWNVSKVTSFYQIFKYCYSLESLNVSTWSTSSASYMKYAFSNCHRLTELDLSAWNMSAATSANDMFSGCDSLAKVTVGDNFKWLESGYLPAQIFPGADGLWHAESDGTAYAPTEIPSGKADTYYAVKQTWPAPRATISGGTDIGSALTVDIEDLPAGNNEISYQWQYLAAWKYAQGSDDWSDSVQLDVHNATFTPNDTWDGFYVRCIVTVASDRYNIEPTVTDVFGPMEKPKTAFAVYSADDGSLDFYKRADVPAVGDTFEGKAVTEVYTGFEDAEYRVVSAGSDGNNWDGDAATDAPWFLRREGIKTVSVVDVGIKPKSVQCWFQGLMNATSLSVSKLDASNCTSFYNTFANCQAATSIDVSGWSAMPVDMTQMFYMCNSVPSLDLSGFDGSQNKTLNSCFHGCTSLNDIKLGDKWATGNVESFSCAFFGTAFKKLDVSGWNTAKGYSFRGTFGGMGNLEELDISGWSNAGAENASDALSTFSSDAKLRTVKVGSGWDWSKSNAKLPAISGDNVAGADGKWYAALDGTGYAPADIPSGKADTYYAVAPSAFAIFSVDDGSLEFYKRAGRPSVGDTWQGKSVDGVYTGFETAQYDYDNMKPITDGLDTVCSTPWYAVKDAIRNVSVVDPGIKAASLRCWFANMLNVEAIDIGKLKPAAPVDCTWTFINCRRMTCVSLPDGLAPSTMADLFYACINLTSDGLSMPNFDMSSCGRAFAAFSACHRLTTIPGIEKWDVSSVWDFKDMFAYDAGLSIDLSGWDVSASDSGSSIPRNFNRNAPGVILPNPWQPTAFAVFSADDGSLDFYRREFAKMPKAGDTFEGKTATEVYTGFENETYTTTGYDPSLDNWMKLIASTPWFEVRDSVSSIKAVDGGIAPISLRSYFYRFEKVRTIDLTKLDLSRTESIHAAFCCDYKVESISLPGITAAATDADSAFAACPSLRTVALGPSDFSGTSSFFHMFMDAGSLTLDCSSWNVREDADHDGFNLRAPGVIIPSAWQTAATSEDAATETAASPAIAVSSDIAPAKSSLSDPWPAATAARAEGPAADDELLEGAESEQDPPHDAGKK